MSEKRKLKKSLLVRLDDEQYACITNHARQRDITANSLVRECLAGALSPSDTYIRSSQSKPIVHAHLPSRNTSRNFTGSGKARLNCVGHWCNTPSNHVRRVMSWLMLKQNPLSLMCVKPCVIWTGSARSLKENND